MKKIRNYLLILSIALFSACELEKTNINPNSPTVVTVNTILPYAQARLASIMNVSPQVMSGIFMQYYQGVDNHALPIQSYIINEAIYVEWDWSDYYNQPMNSLHKLIEKANEKNAPYYSGIAKTLMALCLGNLTSTYGDIPYSEAFMGSEKLNPKFDAQKNIYEEIQNLLDQAISELNAEESALIPALDDIIYNGDLNLWKQAAYALKARYYMHQSKRSAEVNFSPAEKALDAAQNAYTDMHNQMVYQFGFTEAEQNPFFEYCRLNYIKPNSFFTGLLADLSDPREKYLFKKSFGNISLQNAFYTSANSVVPLISHAEVKFIEAEAMLRLNYNFNEIQLVLNEAIQSNMKFISNNIITDTEIENYIAENAQLTGIESNDLQVIMTQKYISLFSSIESWTDYRRTGIPALIPNAGGDSPQNPGGHIPRRLAYPQNERLYNENFPSPAPTLQDRMWIDN